MKALRVCTFVLTLTSPAFTAIAGDQSGTVVSLVGDTYNGPYVFYLSGSRTATPSCATDNGWALANPSSDNSKALFSLVTTAFALGKTVSVHGNGSCDASAPNRESVAYLAISN